MNACYNVPMMRCKSHRKKTEHNKETEVEPMKRVSYIEYQALKAIYNITIVSASDNEALIFIRK